MQREPAHGRAAPELVVVLERAATRGQGLGDVVGILQERLGTRGGSLRPIAPSWLAAESRGLAETAAVEQISRYQRVVAPEERLSANSGRWAFLQLMMQKVQCPEQIVALWDKLFGPNRVEKRSGENDVWITSITIVPCPTAHTAPASALPPTPSP